MWAYGTNDEFEAQRNKEVNYPSQGIHLLDIDMPPIGSDEVLVKVKASALNFNSIWSGLARPLTPFQLISGHVRRNPDAKKHQQSYAIFGSDAAGIIVECGQDVNQWRENDEVIIHCNVVDPNDPAGREDSMLSHSQSIWGYETNFGGFAEYCIVKESQLITKPQLLSWSNAASFSLTLSTAYRMLCSGNAAKVKPGDNVLIWGAAGGLGIFAIQLTKLMRGNAIAVVGDENKVNIVRKFGADAVVVRGKGVFDSLTLDDGTPNYASWARGRAHLKSLGFSKVDLVFEHVGKDTLGFSTFLANRGGSVVICAASSGYQATVDLRYLWMQCKSIIGSHFANNEEAEASAKLIFSGQVRPLIHSVSTIDKLPRAADQMFAGKTFGKMVFTHG